MFVATVVDLENDSFSNKSVTENVEVVGVNEDLDVLKKICEDVDISFPLKWEQDEFGRWIGKVMWDDEEMEDQFYVIVNV
jgi:hypothetical protein